MVCIDCHCQVEEGFPKKECCKCGCHKWQNGIMH